VFVVALSAPGKAVIGSHSQWVVQKNQPGDTGVIVTYWPGPYTILDFSRYFHRTHLTFVLLFSIAILPWAIALAIRYLNLVLANAAANNLLPEKRPQIFSRAALDLAFVSCAISCLFVCADSTIIRLFAACAWVLSFAATLYCGKTVSLQFYRERLTVTWAYGISIINVVCIGMLMLLQPSV
jgi:hypothetical protein